MNYHDVGNPGFFGYGSNVADGVVMFFVRSEKIGISLQAERPADHIVRISYEVHILFS